jgi:Flp pilus assembly pilin Flp
MDWTALLRQSARFLQDEQGGESVEYALTSMVAACTAAAAQRVMTDCVSGLALSALEPPSHPK